MNRLDIIATIRGVPDLISDICAGLTDEQMRRRTQDGEWSLLELACHLRDSAIEEGLRARRMVEEDNPVLDPYDQEMRAAAREYQGDDPKKVMTSLRAYWTGYAYQLDRFSEAEWERPGVQPETGPVTVGGRAELEVEHVQTHVAQMQSARAALASA